MIKYEERIFTTEIVDEINIFYIKKKMNSTINIHLVN